MSTFKYINGIIFKTVNLILTSNWIIVIHSLFEGIHTTFDYYYVLYEYIILEKSYTAINLFPYDKWARVQLYSLSLIFKLWSLPHYRSTSFQQDMKDNLKNVAIPGTGIPLSFFCYHYYTLLIFIVIINPIICFMGSLHHVLFHHKPNTSDLFSQQVLYYYKSYLLNPSDWFSFWRLNCRLISYHSYITKSTDYRQEDKWTFLTEGKELNIPISPYLMFESIVCKNKNIEGGMGIFFYKNAAHGGDWIIQETLTNASWLKALLPVQAPLSTMRIITSSTYAMSTNPQFMKSFHTYHHTNHPTHGSNGINTNHHSSWKIFDTKQNDSIHNYIESDDDVSSTETTTTATLGHRSSDSTINTTTSENISQHQSEQSTIDSLHHKNRMDAKTYIKALSSVLRLGRAGASTDHSSIFYNVDMDTGLITHGTTNAHWYQLGLIKALQTSWRGNQNQSYEIHPDPPHPQVVGNAVPDMQEALDIVIEAHYKMMKEVPLVGWDVAFTPNGIYLLEVNLSCNFFKGVFDTTAYINFVDEYFKDLKY